MYRAPVREVRFVLEELLGAGRLGKCAELADYSDELGQSVLEEAARFAENVLEPLNQPGDRQGARWTPEGVVTAPGFRDAYRQFAAGGWLALGAPPQFGGQSAPRVLSLAVGEFWGSANLAFKLGPMLTHGAAHALELCGSPAQCFELTRDVRDTVRMMIAELDEPARLDTGWVAPWVAP